MHIDLSINQHFANIVIIIIIIIIYWLRRHSTDRNFLIILASFWDHFGFILGPIWDQNESKWLQERPRAPPERPKSAQGRPKVDFLII